MLSVIGLAVIGGMAGFFLSRRAPSMSPAFLILSCSLIGALMGAGLGLVIGLTWEAASPKEWVVTSQDKLVAMRTADTLEGAFIFASGAIGEARYYLYYTEAADGGYQAHRLQAEDKDVIVYEDREEGGVLVIKDLRIVNQKSKLLEYFAFTPPIFFGETYEFHIPKGSLIQEFRLE